MRAAAGEPLALAQVRTSAWPAHCSGLALALTASLIAACGARASRETADAGASDASAAIPPAPSDEAVIAALRPFEEQLRNEIDFRHPPSTETALGADPWKLARASKGYVGILRGRSELVLLDDDLKTVARVAAPRSPTGLAVGPKGEVWVTGELSPVVTRYVVSDHKIIAEAQHRVPDVFGLRDIAVTASGAVWALDERSGRLHSVTTTKGTMPAVVRTSCHGASQLGVTPRHLVVGCATDHDVLVYDVDTRGAITNPLSPQKIHHDGPVWGFDAQEVDGAVVVAVGGVENKALDRREGFFGWVDSFVYVYRFDPGRVAKVAEVNVAESGVVTPKALAITHSAGPATTVFVAAYGSAKAATIEVGAGEPKVKVHPLVPGIRTVVPNGTAMIMADPLLDAWVSFDPNDGSQKIVPAETTPPAVHPQTRLGEALFFTTMMAPENHSGGAHSRFTCETCHFEGYGDGRTHHTGREEIHAVTKPLVGLLGNRPYFTRALDPDLSTIAHAEFRVAGAGNGVSPFFATDAKKTAWLAHLVPPSALEIPLDGYELRRSLMRFLASFSHRPNPAVIGRKAFTTEEKHGATVFRERCERCHAARLAADDPKSAIPFAEWEAAIFSEESPIVWARSGYEKTGVLPYVHPDGARTTSLRRTYKKVPFFTNGSASTIADVVARVRIAGDRFFHGDAPADARPLDEADRAALLSFLELL